MPKNKNTKPTLHLLAGNNISGESVAKLYENLSGKKLSTEEIRLSQLYFDDKISEEEFDQKMDAQEAESATKQAK